MTEYKCISCGYIEDRRETGSCPICGYRMFESPYDRKDVLASEIKRFISRLEVKTVIKEDLVFVGKGADDNRFPSYDKILRYVSSQDKTEEFLDNLLETCVQLKLHFTSQFSKTYPVSFANLNGIIGEYDEVLCDAAKVLNPEISEVPDPVEWEEVSLLYSESQNRYLLFSAK